MKTCFLSITTASTENRVISYRINQLRGIYWANHWIICYQEQNKQNKTKHVTFSGPNQLKNPDEEFLLGVHFMCTQMIRTKQSPQHTPQMHFSMMFQMQYTSIVNLRIPILIMAFLFDFSVLFVPSSFPCCLASVPSTSSRFHSSHTFPQIHMVLSALCQVSANVKQHVTTFIKMVDRICFYTSFCLVL